MTTRVTRFALPAGLALLAVAVGVTACGTDTVLSPLLGAGCSRGTLAMGQVVQGALSDSSCQVTYQAWSGKPAPYESWTVHLTKGKAYMFTERHIPDPAEGGRDSLDALLTLYGKNDDGNSVPLAISDNEAGDGDAVIFFVAPQSGTFQLIDGTYSYHDHGGYQMTANECPVLGTIDTAGTYAFDLKNSPCVRTNAADVLADTSRYSFVAIAAAAGNALDSLDVIVPTTDFQADWEVFGPGFDVFANLYQASRYQPASSPGTLRSFAVAGPVTFAIGTKTADTTGHFTLQVSRTMLGAPPVGSTELRRSTGLGSILPAER